MAQHPGGEPEADRRRSAGHQAPRGALAEPPRTGEEQGPVHVALATHKQATEGLGGLAPRGHDPLAVPAGDPQLDRVRCPNEVGDIEPDGLGDADAGTVEDLDERLVAGRVAPDVDVADPAHVRHAGDEREVVPPAGTSNQPNLVVGAVAVVDEEVGEGAQRGQPPGQRRRRQPWEHPRALLPYLGARQVVGARLRAVTLEKAEAELPHIGHVGAERVRAEAPPRQHVLVRRRQRRERGPLLRAHPPR